jgi:hypothetical protein
MRHGCGWVAEENKPHMQQEIEAAELTPEAAELKQYTSTVKNWQLLTKHLSAGLYQKMLACCTHMVCPGLSMA